MSRYIDAERIEPFLRRKIWGTPDERWRPESEFGLFVDAVPTADVAEVKHGRWEVDDIGIKVVATCSVCRNEIEMSTCLGKPIYSYCPACGAKMESEE